MSSNRENLQTNVTKVNADTYSGHEGGFSLFCLLEYEVHENLLYDVVPIDSTLEEKFEVKFSRKLDSRTFSKTESHISQITFELLT